MQITKSELCDMMVCDSDCQGCKVTYIFDMLEQMEKLESEGENDV